MSRPRVLVADASDKNVRSIAGYLDLEGFACVKAGSVEAATEALGGGAFSGAVIDNSFSNDRGAPLVQLVKSHSPDAAVIALVADESEEDEAFAAGASVTIVRPFHLASIATELRALVPGVGPPRD